MHSIHHLKLISALATHRHFGRAAEALGISQPALSKGLNHLEEVLGAKLFDRTAPVTPTVFGRIVLARGGGVVTAFEEMLREIELTKGLDVGSLTICAGLYPAEISAHEAVGILSGRHPSLQCTLLVKGWVSALDDVLATRCDLAFADITEASANPDLETESLRRSVIRMFCRPGHPLSGRASVSLEELLEYPWVGPSLQGAMRQFLPTEPKPFGVIDPATNTVQLRVLVETFGAIKRIVLGGEAISGAPRALIARDVAEGHLAVLPVDLPWLTLNYGFIWRRGRSLSPAAIEFMEIVRGIEAGLGP